jgi:hypothetical protein
VMTNGLYTGPVNIKTGDGNDTIAAAESIFASNFTVNTQGGADTVSIETAASGIPSVFRGPVAILTGAGADTLNIGANSPVGHAEFKAAAKFDGGADGDTAHVSTLNFQNTYIAGQPNILNFETQD